MSYNPNYTESTFGDLIKEKTPSAYPGRNLSSLEQLDCKLGQERIFIRFIIIAIHYPAIPLLFLSIGTPKNNNFPFVTNRKFTNRKFIIFGCPKI